LAQALPKGKKFEEIIRKNTEIGVQEFLPLITERTEIRYPSHKWRGVHERWKRVAISAMKQSGRTILPDIHPPQPVSDILTSTQNYELKLIASAFEHDVTIRDVLHAYPDLTSVLICIGPEGGFTEAEVTQAKSHDFRAITLGKRRLRTETAGAVAAGIFAGYYDNP